MSAGLVSVLRGVRLTSGPFPLILGAATCAAIGCTLGRRPRIRHVAAAAVAALAAVAAVRLALPGDVDVARIPPSFYVFAWLPAFAAFLALAIWRRGRARRRMAALAAIALSVTFALNEVNVWFAYLPTAADVAGLPLPLETDPSRLATAGPSGALIRVDIPATESRFAHRRALLYLPPAVLRGESVAAAGAIMMLAGTPGAPDDLLRAGGMAEVAARYARQHHGMAPILVFPDHNGSFGGDSECVDGPRGDAESYLTVDVPAYLSERYGVATTNWGIFGYSEGGTCALTLALRHPHEFPAFVDIGGDRMPNLGFGTGHERMALSRLFGGDVGQRASYDPVVLLNERRFDGLSAWLVAGRSDGPARRTVDRLAPEARAAGITVRVDIPAGHHSFGLVKRSAPDAFDWLAAHAGTSASRGYCDPFFPAREPVPRAP